LYRENKTLLTALFYSKIHLFSVEKDADVIERERERDGYASLIGTLHYLSGRTKPIAHLATQLQLYFN
jgi:hypothetical protein